MEVENQYFKFSDENNRFKLTQKTGGVVVILSDQNNNLILIEITRNDQHKHLEFIRGFKESKERYEQAAIREVQEEIGISKDSLLSVHDLGQLMPDSGLIAGEPVHVFVIKVNIKINSMRPQKSEQISKVITLSRTELSNKIRNNEIIDNFTLASFMKYQSHN